MSEYASTDLLPEYWNDMLKLHWDFLEQDESPLKLERRKHLEQCIYKFLSLVPNDRKFFLPETGIVLRKSIMEMENFSAHNAMKGFESISQYANNLCTKPWRKEYRAIKMYSGYYHHEIKKNLVCAEELFIAMGYKRGPNEMLVLNEPICPDQVANVSRDCMTAYIECEIMKKMKTTSSDQKLSATWKDIYLVRENIVGDFSTSMKALVSHFSFKDYRERPSENIYATIKHNPVGHMNNVVSNCTKCLQQPLHYMHTNECAIHQGMQPQQQQHLHLPPMPQQYNNMQHNGYNIYQQHYPYVTQQIPHSKSLEHYNNENGAQYHLPHRHSFDQPNHYETLRSKSHIYETPYDCIDGHHQYPLQFQNAYHSPGNRNPLPMTFTNQYFPSSPPPPPPKHSQNHYFSERNGYNSSSSKEFTTNTKSYPPISAEQQFNEFSSSYKKQQPTQQPQVNHNKTGAFRNRNFEIGSSSTATNLMTNQLNEAKNDVEHYSIHTQPQLQTQSQKPQSRKSNNKLLDNNNKYLSTATPTSTSDSYEETSLLRKQQQPRHTTPRARNEEGVGSFENWDFVYQSLENHKQHNGQSSIKTNNIPQNQNVEPPKVEKTSRVARNVATTSSNLAAAAATTKDKNVWECSFCTYYNENKTRICAMCSKTKDFHPTDSYNKPTCV